MRAQSADCGPSCSTKKRGGPSPRTSRSSSARSRGASLATMYHAPERGAPVRVGSKAARPHATRR